MPREGRVPSCARRTRRSSAHTCFNHLLLPEYQSLEHTQKQLVKAIQDTEGFHIV